MSSSAEHLGVVIVPVCFLCALKEGLSGRAGTGVGWELKGRWLPSANAHLQHLRVKELQSYQDQITILLGNLHFSQTAPHSGCF